MTYYTLFGSAIIIIVSSATQTTRIRRLVTKMSASMMGFVLYAFLLPLLSFLFPPSQNHISLSLHTHKSTRSQSYAVRGEAWPSKTISGTNHHSRQTGSASPVRCRMVHSHPTNTSMPTQTRNIRRWPRTSRKGASTSPMRRRRHEGPINLFVEKNSDIQLRHQHDATQPYRIMTSQS